jgi:hypothetical protein
MTPEELDRKMEFLAKWQVEFAARQERDHGLLIHGFDTLARDIADLRESTARFQVFATELIRIQSDRLDRQDKFYRDALIQTDHFQRQTLHLLNLILDRLPPKQEAT